MLYEEIFALVFKMSFIRKEKGPFDIIGDIHGCFFELEILLKRIGYTLSKKEEKFFVTHPDIRQVIFLGDLVDRSPRSAEALKLVKDMVYSGIAFCVNGNHDDKLKRKLMERNVKTNQDLEETLEQLNQETDGFRETVLLFLKELRDDYIFDDGKLVVSHAGLKEEYFGKSSKRIHAFCLYG
jgi:protein phosphatase